MADAARGKLERCLSCQYFKCVCAPPTLESLRLRLEETAFQLRKTDLIGPSFLFEKIPKENILSTWQKINFSPEGSFVIESSPLGESRLTFNRKNKGWFVVRRINKLECRRANQLLHIKTEIAVLKALKPIRHPALTSCVATMVTECSVHVVSEYIPGGTLFAYLRKRRTRFEEDDAKFYITQVILAVGALHDLGVIHRNVTPQTCYITADGYIKLGGLNVCRVMDPTQRTYTFCGPVEYMAPEVPRGAGYSMSVDWWMVGVMLYELIHNALPFADGKGSPTTLAGAFTTSSSTRLSRPFGLSNPMWDLIRSLLSAEASQRLGGKCGLDSEEIRAHRWFRFYRTATFSWDKVLAKEYPAPYTPVLHAENDVSHYGAQPGFVRVTTVDAKWSHQSSKTLAPGFTSSESELEMESENSSTFLEWRKQTVFQAAGASMVS